MPALLDSLQRLPHRDLRAIATRLGVRRRGQNRKAAWVESLAAFWSSPHQANALLATLSPAALRALHRLYQAHALPAPPFLAECGAIRQAGRGPAAPPPPWQAPRTVSEELYYAGLLFPLPAGNIRQAQWFALADEVLPLLATLWSAPQVAETSCLSAQTSGPATLVHDVGQTLIFLCADPALRLNHGRWLYPSEMATLNQRLLAPDPEPLPPSHRRTRRMRFLFFLVTAADLAQGRQVTPLGSAWLAASSARQVATLWTAWQAAESDTRAAYSQPEARLPAPWPVPLLEILATQRTPFAVATLSNLILGQSQSLRDFFATHLPDLSTLDRLIQETLDGALAAFGAVLALPLRQDPQNPGPGPTAGGDYVLTEAGAWLLRGRHGRPPRWLNPTVPPQSPRIETDPAGWQVIAPARRGLVHQARLAPYAQHQGLLLTAEGPLQRYQLDAHTVASAAAAGYGLPGLAHALHGLGLALDGPQMAQLQRWHAQGQMLRLSPLSVLQAATPALMAEIQQRPALRDMLGELLSSTVSTVIAPPATVAAKLRQAGYYPAQAGGPRSPAEAAAEGAGGSERAPATAPGPADAADSGSRRTSDGAERAEPADPALWLAGQLYVLLGEQLDLPLPPPFTRLAAEWRHFPPAQQALLETQWQALREQVLDLLDGHAFTPPPTPADPDLWRPIIADALARGAYLDMTYFTAGRNMLTRRVVEPYWIEEAHGVPYLRAHCHTTGKVLLFRLDRIMELVDR